MMQDSMVEICNENISGAQIRTICESLQKGNVKAVSLRECVITDKEYKKIMKVVGSSETLRHLTFNIGMITDAFRIQVLSQGLMKNRSLTGLFIHGNEIGNEGMKILYPSMTAHPHITVLDVGDCGLGDDGLELVCGLVKTTPTRPGLYELVLSHNPAITMYGWTKLGVAMAAGCLLRELYVDYNEMGDPSASCILVALPGARRLEVLDMECVGVTETSAQVLLHILQNYPVALKQVNLEENDISKSTIEAIKMHMPELLESEHDTDVISDEEPSLATSEPPLDGGCVLGDVDNNSSSVNFIQIAGAPDSIYDDTADSGMTEGGDSIVPERPASGDSSNVWIPGPDGGVAEITEGGDVVLSRANSPALVHSRTSSPNAHKQGKMASKSLADIIQSTREVRRSSVHVSVCGNSEMGETQVAPLFSKSERGIAQMAPLITKSDTNIGGNNPSSVHRQASFDYDRQNTMNSPVFQKQVVGDGGLTSIEILEQVEDIEDMDNEELNSAHSSLRSCSLHTIVNEKTLLTVPQTHSRRGSLDILHGPSSTGSQSTSSIGQSRRCSAPVITVTNLSVHKPKRSPKRTANKVGIMTTGEEKDDQQAHDVKRRLSTVSSVFGNVAVEEL